MRTVLLIFLTLSAVAHAQFGTGLFPGSSCGTPFGPSQNAFNGGDEVHNLDGQLRAREARIHQLQDKEDRLNERLSRAKSRMARVITARGFAAIREHRERNNGYNSYRKDCGNAVSANDTGGGRAPADISGGRAPADIGGGRSPADASGATDQEVFDDGVAGRGGGGGDRQYPIPQGFCITNPATGRVTNVWEKFVEEDGTVSTRICNFRISGITHAASRADQDDCRAGLDEYYDLMDEKARLREQIAVLDREARQYERRLERIQDEITEGTYCPWCAAQRRGYSNMGTGNSMMQGVGVLAMLGMQMMQPRRPMMPPPPPPMMMGRPPMMMGAPVMPYGGPGYPVRPYQAQIPGYYGVSPGMMPGGGTYGGIPGGIGPGGFGCQGANPSAFGSPFGSPMVNPIYGGMSPFNNPYANPMMNPMFNQGAGPGWGFPMYGNGMPAFQNPFGFGNNPYSPYNQNPFASPFAQNPFGGPNPYAANPYGMNPGMNPYGMNPYGNQFGMNPYDPYGSNPWMNPNGGGFNPYGFNPYGPGYPYQGAFNPYGAPGTMPYMGMNPYGGYGLPYGPGYGSPYGGGGYPGYAGYPGYGGYPGGYGAGAGGWGSPYGNPLGNYMGQVNMLQNRLQYISGGGGGYYGAGGAYAPPTMPYLSTPQYQYNAPGAYSYPGTYSYPGARGNAPAILPYTR